ncbi:hypothetical protein PENTCL1PPCAC_22017, partial [Pristionchus entomophagus]
MPEHNCIKRSRMISSEVWFISEEDAHRFQRFFCDLMKLIRRVTAHALCIRAARCLKFWCVRLGKIVYSKFDRTTITSFLFIILIMKWFILFFIPVPRCLPYPSSVRMKLFLSVFHRIANIALVRWSSARAVNARASDCSLGSVGSIFSFPNSCFSVSIMMFESAIWRPFSSIKGTWPFEENILNSLLMFLNGISAMRSHVSSLRDQGERLGSGL